MSIFELIGWISVILFVITACFFFIILGIKVIRDEKRDKAWDKKMNEELDKINKML